MKTFKQNIQLIFSLLIILPFTVSSCGDDDDDLKTMGQLTTATLSGAQEVPPVSTQATGSISGTYDSVTNVLTYNLTFSGLTPSATAAHFHKGSANQSGPVVVPIGQGTLTSPINAQATLTQAQEVDLLAGLWYVNVHSPAFPAGEIRTQLIITF